MNEKELVVKENREDFFIDTIIDKRHLDRDERGEYEKYAHEKAMRELGWEYAKRYATARTDYWFKDHLNDSYVFFPVKPLEPEGRFTYMGKRIRYKL